MTNLLESLKRKAEDLDWSWIEYEDGDVYLSKYSPAGEDFFVALNTKDLVAGVRGFCDSFNAEEHVHKLLDAKENGVGDIPSLKELVEDADAIQEMLEELADAMEAIEKEAGK